MRKSIIKFVRDDSQSEIYYMTFDDYDIGDIKSGETFTVETSPGFHTAGIRTKTGSISQRKVYAADSASPSVYRIRTNMSGSPIIDVDETAKQNHYADNISVSRSQAEKEDSNRSQSTANVSKTRALEFLALAFAVVSLFANSLLSIVPAIIAFVCAIASAKVSGKKTPLIFASVVIACIGIVLGIVSLPEFEKESKPKETNTQPPAPSATVVPQPTSTTKVVPPELSPSPSSIPATSDINDYTFYSPGEIKRNIEANPLRKENYINSGVIIEAELTRISEDGLSLSPENTSSYMSVDVDVSKISKDLLKSLNKGDTIQVKGICTELYSNSIKITAAEINVIVTNEEKQTEKLSEVKAALENSKAITMEQLLKEARANPIAFADYEGKYLAVTGKVRKIGEYTRGITLSDAGNNCDLECVPVTDGIEEAMKKLEIGGYVTVLGQVKSIVNANNDIAVEPAGQFLEGFIDGMMGISTDGFNMYFDVYEIR